MNVIKTKWKKVIVIIVYYYYFIIVIVCIKIDVFPKFDKSKMDDEVCGKEVRHEKEFGLVANGENVTQVCFCKISWIS